MKNIMAIIVLFFIAFSANGDERPKNVIDFKPHVVVTPSMLNNLITVRLQPALNAINFLYEKKLKNSNLSDFPDVKDVFVRSDQDKAVVIRFEDSSEFHFTPDYVLAGGRSAILTMNQIFKFNQIGISPDIIGGVHIEKDQLHIEFTDNSILEFKNSELDASEGIARVLTSSAKKN